MPRLTKQEIESTLLAGKALTGLGGKNSTLALGTAAQRRLYRFLLGHVDQQVLGISESFTDGLWEAFSGEDDPAKAESASAAASGAKTAWRIKSMTTQNFGGINSWGSPTFKYEFDGESLTVDGPNGSGKSSLAAALIWAFTGQRPRDQASSSAHLLAPVMNAQDKRVGDWPPIATYPPRAADIKTIPEVKVEIVLENVQGETLTLFRQLKSGVMSDNLAELDVAEVFLSTGLVMPARIGQIRLNDDGGGLTGAVQQLTGLDEVVKLGLLCDWLTHGARDYRNYSKTQKLADHEAEFATAMKTAKSLLESIGKTVPDFKPADGETKDGALITLGVEITDTSKSLTDSLAADLATELNANEAAVQKRIIQAIDAAKAKLDLGVNGLASWTPLDAIRGASTGEGSAALLAAALQAELDLEAAIQADAAFQADTRRQLKALGAAWHRDHSGGAIDDCPLCQQSLHELADLKVELEALKAAGAAATKTFADNVNQITESLRAALPGDLMTNIGALQGANPAALLIGQFREAFGSAAPHAKSLTGFSALAETLSYSAPSNDLPPVASTSADTVSIVQKRLIDLIAGVRRGVLLGQWMEQSKGAWESWWATLVVEAAPVQTATSDTSGGVPATENLSQHLNRLSKALEAAEPYALTAAQLRVAVRSGREVLRIQAEQARRDKVAEAIAPLKDLKSVGESVARQAIEDLAARIQEILRGMHKTERLQFRSAELVKKEGVLVRAAFDDEVRIDATLIANTSWLRAVLWAFVFALREEAVEQHGGDPLPVFVFDDPQATFDVVHRLNWAHYVAGLQASDARAQIILATHEELFLTTLRTAQINTRYAHIAPARPDTGPLAILEGDALERKWRTCDADRADPAKSVAFLAECRVYIEGMLRSMLAGDGADLTNESVGALSKRIADHHAARRAPWDRRIFGKLVDLLKGPPLLAYIEHAHHGGTRNALTYAEASAFHQYWTASLASKLLSCFEDVREHRLLHGTVTAWKLPPPSAEFPEGYQHVLAQYPLNVLGRASAFSDGKVSEGRFSYEDIAPGARKQYRLANHAIFRLCARTVEPVARQGDLLIVRKFGDAVPGSLVVARVDTQLMARRFVISDRSSDVAVLTAHAVDPHDIAAPVVAHKTTLALEQVVGVIFDTFHPRPAGSGDEILQCNGEAEVGALLAGCSGLVEVNGHSAQPLALNGQYLLLGRKLDISSAADLRKVDGKPVVAADAQDARYFKRLRLDAGDFIILESLDASGEHGPVVLDLPGTNSDTALTALWPVNGVLFELPGS